MINGRRQLPEVFRSYFARLEEQHHPPGSPFTRCFGCGPEHPNGLGMRWFRDNEEIVSPIVISDEHEGPRGAAHGGLVALYMDEVMSGAVFRHLGRPAVTGEMTVRYIRRVPTRAPLLARGRTVTDHGRYIDAEGRLEEFESGRLLATARGRFFPLKS
jgi:acyl-coenzyme A thioesterase PaaI-like protein